jgi:hypothetical protein
MWSPGNQWIAFFAAGRLKKVRSQGGPVEPISDLPGFQEGSWGSKGDIVFRRSNREPLFLLRSSGGNSDTDHTSRRILDRKLAP